MKLHELKPTPGSKPKKKRVGRGKAAGGGTYAGRGIKGQGARGRRKKKAYFEGGQLPLVRRLPFKRGFTNIFRVEYQEVNLDMLEKRFDAGDTVNVQTLAEKGLIRDELTPVKVLGRGEITKNLTVEVHRISKSAAEKLEQAGGSFTKVELEFSPLEMTIRKPRKEDIAKRRAEQDNE